MVQYNYIHGNEDLIHCNMFYVTFQLKNQTHDKFFKFSRVLFKKVGLKLLSKKKFNYIK
jgi:hypothetical protein